jgi:hypothetical protein
VRDVSSKSVCFLKGRANCGIAGYGCAISIAKPCVLHNSAGDVDFQHVAPDDRSTVTHRTLA